MGRNIKIYLVGLRRYVVRLFIIYYVIFRAGINDNRYVGSYRPV